MKDDFELLQDYLRTGSEPAFTELVTRHKGLVYASALRQTANPALAEEITQAVFIVLARKAEKIKPGVVLSGWLFQATRFAARDALKREQRRVLRETNSLLMNPESEQSPAPEEESIRWNEIAPALDDSIASLGEKDRHALLLRYFEQRKLADVGKSLGLSEDATRKRIERALEKLKLLLGKRGVVASVTLLAGALMANAAPLAPATLTISTTTAAGAGITSIAKGTIALMAWSKTKIAALTVVMLLLATGSAVLMVSLVRHFASDRAPIAAQPSFSQPAPVDPPAQMVISTFAPSAPDADGFISLFNGKDLSGWNHNPNIWSVTNGAIMGHLATNASGTVHYLAWAGGMMDDFELRLQFRTTGNANCGVPLRARWSDQRWFPGYQLELHGQRTGLLVIAGAGRERQLSRQGWRSVATEANGVDSFQSLERVSEPAELSAALAAVEGGAWCDFVAIAKGRRFVARLNGVTIIDTEDQHPTKFVPRGMLGLEYMHREGAADSVEFREIRLKRG